MDGTVASCSVFSEAFFVGGEGELREAELRIESWIIQHNATFFSVAFGSYCVKVEVSFASSSGSENEAPFRVVNFDWTGGNNGTI